MNRIPGVVIGLVNSLDDPEGLGRVQLTFPWMSESEPESNWARIAAPMAGPERGFQFMPEVGDEVLVAFEQGELRMPYVLGYLWNGEDRPPRDDPKLRTVKTVSGHVLEFDDTEGSEKITLQTQGGHKLAMQDGDGTLLIETSGGNQLEMKDTPASLTIKTPGGQEIQIADTPAGITVQTATGNKISVSDAPPGVTIDAPSGMVNINCLQAAVSATALLNVSAPFATFSGILQTQTLIATAVVSSSYTPGAGNML